MAQIIDLDEVLGEDKRVRLGGVQYTLPPDLPVELYLRINRFESDGTNDVDMVQALYDELLGLFRYRKPDLTSLPVSMTQLVVAVGKIYGGDGESDERPPQRSRSGTATKSGRSRSASKSRS